MFLSILVPTKYSEKFQKFYESLVSTVTDPSDIELVILEDGDGKSLTRNDGLTYFKETRLTMAPNATRSEQLQYCTESARGEFVWYANDDVTSLTNGWDDHFRKAVSKFADKIVLVWPNDGFFRARLSIFPLISREFSMKLFPLPYWRYKIDDTIFDLFPPIRRIYLDNVIMQHGDGKTYSCEPIAYRHDEDEFIKRIPYRMTIRQNIREAIPEYNGMRIFICSRRGLRPQTNEFYDHYNIMDKPANSILQFTSGQSPARGFNILIEQAIQHKCDFLVSLDDDTAFNNDVIYKLYDSFLMRPELDIVTGLYFKRDYPHEPILFDTLNPDGSGTFHRMSKNDVGIKDCEGGGFGCVMMRVPSLAKLPVEKNLYSGMRYFVTLGGVEKDMWCDDTAFYKMCKENGLKMAVNFDIMVGHQGNVTIWPNRNGDDWTVVYRTNSPGAVQFRHPYQD